MVPIIFFTIYFNNRTSENTDFDTAANNLLLNHSRQYQAQEYYSGAALSIAIPGKGIHNYYLGTVSHDKNSTMVTKDTLFEIGSITKSFSSALVLLMEKEGKLSLSDTLGMYQPQYKKWSNKTIESLLNMTSGLPNYTNAIEFNATIFSKPDTIWSTDQLIGYAYPSSDLTPPIRTGFYYSNTAYLLAGKIVEVVSGQPLDKLFLNRIIKPAQLTNTYYFPAKINAEVYSRLAHGYSYDPYAFPSQLGKDVSSDNLTSTGADGAIIASTEDIVKWVQALFIDSTILDDQQKNKLMSLVSSNTGKAINDVSKTDPDGFGLGVSKHFNPDYPKESMWSYEGRMFGFRAIYLYVPCNNVIVAASFNSATDDQNDHADKLLNAAYDLIIKNYPELRCK